MYVNPADCMRICTQYRVNLGSLLLLQFRETASTQPVSAQCLPRVVHQILLAKHTLQCWIYTHTSRTVIVSSEGWERVFQRDRHLGTRRSRAQTDTHVRGGGRGHMGGGAWRRPWRARLVSRSATERRWSALYTALKPQGRLIKQPVGTHFAKYDYNSRQIFRLLIVMTSVKNMKAIL